MLSVQHADRVKWVQMSRDEPGRKAKKPRTSRSQQPACTHKEHQIRTSAEATAFAAQFWIGRYTPQRCHSTSFWPRALTLMWRRTSSMHIGTSTPPPCNLPPFVRPVPPLGGGGIAPQNCTIVSQCKSASAPSASCKNFLWRLWRLVLSMLFGPSDGSPAGGGGDCKGEGGGGAPERVVPRALLHPLHRTICSSVLKNVTTYPPPPNPAFLKLPFLTDFKKHTPPPKILAHRTKNSQKPGKVPKPTVLAHTECPREKCPGSRAKTEASKAHRGVKRTLQEPSKMYICVCRQPPQ